MSRDDILDILREKKQYLRDEFHIVKIGLFGSYAKLEQKDDSDIDLLIDIEEGAKDIYDLKLSLKEYLSGILGKKVDLAREKYLKPYVKDRILKDVVYV